MQWESGRRSGNVIDMRGRGTRMVAGGGVGMALLALVVYLLGGDPRVVTDAQQPAPAQETGQAGAPDPKADFVSVVLGDTEDAWNAILKQRYGRAYEPPHLVMFTGAVESACGFAQAAMGPFYCPRDQRVYIDLGFLEELRQRFHAPGDFAQAYVIAHEVGHHVQMLLGISDKVTDLRQRSGRAQANALSVRTELQADCFAGIWAHHAQHVKLDPGDIDEALAAASAIGDDTLQKRSQGYVVPESFTHGTSAQRTEWFRRGFDAGTLEACDTFRN